MSDRPAQTAEPYCTGERRDRPGGHAMTSTPTDTRTRKARPMTTRLARAITVHQAWMEDHEMWDGYALYLDEDTAKARAADDYEAAEYGDPEDREEGDSQPLLTWEAAYDRWHLLDHGKDTGVRVSAMPVHRPASKREIEAQDALAAAKEAARSQSS